VKFIGVFKADVSAELFAINKLWAGPEEGPVFFAYF
jgi:hypothetical protein